MSPLHPSGEDGFGVVEAIVAFAILALVLAATVEVVGYGAVRQRTDERRMTALLNAQGKLAELGAGRTIPVGTVTGHFHDDFFWRMTASPVDRKSSEGQGPELYHVTVDVSDPRSDEVVQLRTILIGEMEAGAR